MADRSFHVFGLGQCSLDYIGRIEEYPPPDAKCEFTGMMIQGGGPVATALTALARWGLNCIFCGVVGNDSFGRAIERSLREEGVSTSGLVTRKGFTSQFAFIAVESGSTGRTIFWQRPTGSPLKPEEVPIKKLKQAHLLHTDGLFVEASLSAAHTARKNGIHVIVDAGTLRNGMLELAKVSDCYITSEAFARDLTGGGNPIEACRMLRGLGPHTVCVTMGSKGYVALAGDRQFSKAAYKVKAVDTTGCGDVFHAGFIYGFLKGWKEERCLDLGAWAAAMVSRKMGGRSGIPALSELRKKYR